LERELKKRRKIKEKERKWKSGAVARRNEKQSRRI